jgi:hypothetical protein
MKKTIFFLTIVLVSCTASTKRTNMPQDIDAGKALADKFYALMKTGSYHEASMLFGEKVTPAAAEELLVSLAEPQGEMGEVTFNAGSSTVSEENGKTTGDINLDYTVKYELLTKEEQLNITYVDNKMVIAGFHSDPK